MWIKLDENLPSRIQLLSWIWTLENDWGPGRAREAFLMCYTIRKYPLSRAALFNFHSMCWNNFQDREENYGFSKPTAGISISLIDASTQLIKIQGASTGISRLISNKDRCPTYRENWPNASIKTGFSMHSNEPVCNKGPMERSMCFFCCERGKNGIVAVAGVYERENLNLHEYALCGGHYRCWSHVNLNCAFF